MFRIHPVVFSPFDQFDGVKMNFLFRQYKRKARHKDGFGHYVPIEYRDGVSKKTYKTAFRYLLERILYSQIGKKLVFCGPDLQ
jgi:hypothetical protein